MVNNLYLWYFLLFQLKVILVETVLKQACIMCMQDAFWSIFFTLFCLCHLARLVSSQCYWCIIVSNAELKIVFIFEHPLLHVLNVFYLSLLFFSFLLSFCLYSKTVIVFLPFLPTCNLLRSKDFIDLLVCSLNKHLVVISFCFIYFSWTWCPYVGTMI